MATKRIYEHTGMCYSRGTQVVLLDAIINPQGIISHPKGAVAVVSGPSDQDANGYSIIFANGNNAQVSRDSVTMLARFQEDEQHPGQIAAMRETLKLRVIFRCVIGSRAYGLDGESSDTDRRGVFLPPTRLVWSLQGCPQHLEDNDT